MTIRPLRFGAAALVTLALAACTSAAEKAKVDSTAAAANATQTVTTPVDSSIKIDSSAKPDSSAAKPEKK
ncbi:MAG: hypothetical protein H7099_00895 [Gemmatimonadaceae bacterium]|nr:hypothetical protein [Gemmatimonadaceae bacterium]